MTDERVNRFFNLTFAKVRIIVEEINATAKVFPGIIPSSGFILMSLYLL